MTTLPIPAVWTKPGEVRKALVAALVAFLAPAGLAVTDTLQHAWSATSLALWMSAVIAALVAAVGVFYFPNDPSKAQSVQHAAEKLAADIAAHNTAAAITDATAVADSFKRTYVQGSATPPPEVIKPAATVVSEPAAPYTGPVPPVSEPVGATAVSAVP